MTRYAIIISVEDYNNYNPTRFTHADNDLLFDTLTNKCDYAVQHTICLKLSPDNPKSPKEILDEIKSVVSSSDSGDSILFYFAGHGHYDLDNGKTYLILPDTVGGDFERTALKFEDISSVLREANRSCFRIFDACHSGADVRDSKDTLNSQDFMRAINEDKSAFGWVTLAACKEDEASIGDPKIGHGVFTYYLCKAIEKIKLDTEIMPEILKINIVEDVLSHSKDIGHIQTPTLIASISGNISVATRKQTHLPAEVAVEFVKDLERRIEELSSIDDIVTNDFLAEALEEATNQCRSDFKNIDKFGYEVEIIDKIKVFEIPEELEKTLINFSEGKGFNPRHTLKKKVTYEDPSSSLHAFMPTSMLKRKRKVEYLINQPSHMPDSIMIIRMYGDKRCLPDIRIVVYVIPLQITACILVSVFNYGWNDDSEEAKLICNYYQMIKPDDNIEKIKEIGAFASEEASKEITKIIESRVELLERELDVK